MASNQVFCLIVYVLVARAILAFPPAHWRSTAFALLNVTGVWVYFHSNAAILDPTRLGIYGVYVALVVFQFAMLRMFAGQPGWRPWLAFFTPIAALAVIKYVPTFDLFWQLTGKKPFSVISAHFIGLSYLAFRASKLVLDVRNGVVKKPGFWEYLTFCFFLPTMSVGPINSYEKFQQGFGTPDRAALPLGRSALRILVGLVKCIVLAHVCYQFSYGGLLLDGHPHRAVELVVAVLAYYLYLYANFSGFCDVAIGMAGLLGFPVEENFDNPLAARNIQEFWNRWHMTLSRYMRDVVFTPLCKWLIEKFGPSSIHVSVSLAILAVYFLVGIWHGVGWNYAAFGLANGLGLVVVYLYGVGLKKWLGKEGYKRYVRNPWIRAVAVVVNFAYVAACLSLFANDFPTLRKILSILR